MDKNAALIFDSLQKLIELHSQLLEACRLEREALVQADLKGIEQVVLSKQTLVESIRLAESERIKRLGSLAMVWKRPVRELSLPNLILTLQDQDLKSAEQMSGAYNALTILIERITEANESNRRLVERSLDHVDQMKRNVLGEAVPKSNTYTAQGQRQTQTSGARLFNKEA